VKTLALFLFITATFGCTSMKPTTSSNEIKNETTNETTNVYDFTVKDIMGDQVDLSDYQGRVLLIVNVASKCGYTKHYSSLEQLYRTYKSKGLVILGFPANDFGAQEPGTNEEIAEFCRASFNVTFPMFSKIRVKGPEKAPLYAYLTEGGGNQEFAGALEWNFVKFLINRNGKIVHRFSHRLDPLDAEFVAAVESALK